MTAALAPRRSRALLSARLDPLAVWRAAADSPWRFWLDSGSAGAGRFTYLAWGEPRWVLRGRGRAAEFLEPGRAPKRFVCDDPAAVLRERLASLPGAGAGFPGGAVGYWGYDCARFFDRLRGEFPAASGGAESAAPDYLWVAPPFRLALDRDGGAELTGPSPEELDGWRRRLERLPAGRIPPPPARAPDRSVLSALERNRASFVRGVRRVQALIAAGDVYQANLTHRVDLPWPAGVPAERFFAALRALNPSPYACLFAAPGFSLASCSPELLLRARGGRVETRPIAGTRPRGDSAASDARLSGELLLSPKERAEHVMLVDLERNDLGRVCRPGTVRVAEKMTLEKYSHVTHIVSHVEGRLRAGRTGFDAARALFPGGTITGCPKIRCMEILADLEGERRGPFFGSAGWIGPDGDADLNILIRTAVIAGGRLSFRVGAGIVADSEPEAEYDETLHKARALVAAYAAATAERN